ncbi:MAG: hypothetical protein RLZZ312_881 [Bacteroidota bacterium]
MKNINYFLTFLALNSALNSFAQTLKPEQIRLHSLAKQVTITRDNWGIAHIFGKTDADAVFGMLYAQCEDDFQRIEMNYIEKLGRLSEIKGEKHVYNDLENRLLLKEADAKKDYKNAPLGSKNY